MATFDTWFLVLDFPVGSPQREDSLRDVVKHHFDDKYLANKGIDF
jgi:hypothetical protein